MSSSMSMLSRPLVRAALPAFRLASNRTSARNFQTSCARLAEGTAPTTIVRDARKPIGAFRGSLFGFLFGSTLAGVGTYYYVLEEYRVANEMLTEDIYALQAAVQRIHTYVTSLEEKVDAMEKKKK